MHEGSSVRTVVTFSRLIRIELREMAHEQWCECRVRKASCEQSASRSFWLSNEDSQLHDGWRQLNVRIRLDALPSMTFIAMLASLVRNTSIDVVLRESLLSRVDWMDRMMTEVEDHRSWALFLESNDFIDHIYSLPFGSNWRHSRRRRRCWSNTTHHQWETPLHRISVALDVRVFSRRTRR